ncbi:MAG: phenylalanine--tRNA ligase subunit beta [Candidatus Paceibacterota bacterium]
MKISYNWLKWYIPEAPSPKTLEDIFTYHLCEVEGVEEIGEGENKDYIFDINILPNRAHDLLSHIGIARELASLLSIPFVHSLDKYKKPEPKNTNLKIEINVPNVRRYMGRIVRDVQVVPSPEWVVKHLESVGARSINNIVDATNIVMYNLGQPAHAFDLDKITGTIVVRYALPGEEMTTLDNKQVKLESTDVVIADEKNILAIAGVKGGKVAEVDNNTKNILLEIANFDPIAVRKTARRIGIFTDSAKRFENDLSPSLGDLAMTELSGLLMEYSFSNFEDVVDVYQIQAEKSKLSFDLDRISNILGITVAKIEMQNILERYHFEFTVKDSIYEINIPSMRLDLNLEEDMAEEVGRILGYDKLNPKIPKLAFVPQKNEVYFNSLQARSTLLSLGYSEVMTYSFTSNGEVEVLASASDKKFLRTNLSDGLKESIKLNQNNLPLLNIKEVKVFEIGKVFKDNVEVLHVAFGDRKNITEMSLSDFIKERVKEEENTFLDVLGSSSPQPDIQKKHIPSSFAMWSLFPFITRDIAVWVPETEGGQNLENLLKENITELCVKGPIMFDSFTKEGKTSYGFRMVFQSYEKTLTDLEVNSIMDNITNKIKENPDWQVR